MPVDDEGMPPQPSQQPEPDLDNDPIELGSGGGPPAPPGGGTLAPVPEDDSFDLEMFMDSGNTDEGHSPGGGPSGYGPSPDEPPVQKEYHDEAPPPGGPPGAPGAVPQFSLPDQVLSPPMPWPAPATPIVPVPIPPHPQFPLPQSLRPASPRNVAPTTEGEFPTQQTPLPEPTQEPPVPDADGDSDSDATVDYREDSLLALAIGDEDVLVRLLQDFKVDPSFVPLDGDRFASWLTKQDKVKAGTVTRLCSKNTREKFALLNWRSSSPTWTMTLFVLLTVASLVAMLIFLPVAGFSL